MYLEYITSECVTTIFRLILYLYIPFALILVVICIVLGAFIPLLLLLLLLLLVKCIYWGCFYMYILLHISALLWKHCPISLQSLAPVICCYVRWVGHCALRCRVVMPSVEVSAWPAQHPGSKVCAPPFPTRKWPCASSWTAEHWW